MGKQKRPVQKTVNKSSSWDDYLKRQGKKWEDVVGIADDQEAETDTTKQLYPGQSPFVLEEADLSGGSVMPDTPYFKPEEEDTLKIKDVPAVSETTKQGAADSFWRKTLTQEAEPKPPSDLELKLTELGKVRKEIETKAESLDKGNEVAITDYNQLIEAYNTELDKLKEEYPAFRLDPKILQNTSINAQGMLPQHELTQGGLTDQVGTKDGAEAYSTLTKSMYQNKPIGQIEKESGLSGTSIGRLAGSVGQGVVSVPAGVAGFVDHITDTLGITDKRQKGFAAKTLEEWSQALAPADPNYMEKIASGFGSMAVFLPLGIGATSLTRALTLVSPKLAHHIGTGAMTLVEAMTEAGNVYNQTGNGIAAEKSFWANLILIGITNRFGIRNEKIQGDIYKTIASSGFEGMQEFGQNLIESFSKGEPVNWMEAVEDFGVGAIVGSAFAGGGSEVTLKSEEKRKLSDLGKSKISIGKTDAIQKQIREEMDVRGKGKLEQDKESIKTEPEGKGVTEEQPSEAQIEAGNYKKEHVRKEGFEVSIENKRGSVRSGKDKSGKEWNVEMQNDYGYLRGTQGKDKDHLDVILSNDYKEESPAFVVNQTTPEGKFDEHKVLFGFKNKDEALQAYLSNYEKGWDNYKNIVQMPMDEFKQWSEDKTKTKVEAPEVKVKKPVEGVKKFVDKEFEYIHNTEKAPNMGERFGQHIEPIGKYVTEKPTTFKEGQVPNIESGKITFKNPLIMDWGGGYGELTNWKNVLSEKYKAKGKSLTDKLLKDGYDGIITIDKKGNTSEIVILKQPPKIEKLVEKPSVSKQPYEMTQKEYGIDRNKNLPNAYVKTPEIIEWEHKQTIQQAIKEGKIESHPDYPELSKGKQQPQYKLKQYVDFKTTKAGANAGATLPLEAKGKIINIDINESGEPIYLVEYLNKQNKGRRTYIKESEIQTPDNNKVAAQRMFGEGKKDTDIVKALGLTGREGMDQVRQWRKEFEGSGAFINELAKELERTGKIRRQAILGGKRSKSSVNIDRLAEKYGIDKKEVDRLAGIGTLSSIDSDFATIKKAIEDAYKPEPKPEKPKKLEPESLDEAVLDYVVGGGLIKPTKDFPRKLLLAMGINPFKISRNGMNPERIFETVAPTLWDAKYKDMNVAQSELFENLMSKHNTHEKRKQALEEMRAKLPEQAPEQADVEAYKRLDEIILNEYLSPDGELNVSEIIQNSDAIAKQAKVDEAVILKYLKDKAAELSTYEFPEDVFGEFIKNEDISNERAKEIIESAKAEELRPIAEAVESKAEVAEDLSDKEIEQSIREADQVIRPTKVEKEIKVPEMYGREGADDLTKLKDYKKHLKLSIVELEKIDAKGDEAISRYYKQYGKSPTKAIIGIEAEIKSVQKKIDQLQTKGTQTDIFKPSTQENIEQKELFEEKEAVIEEAAPEDIIEEIRTTINIDDIPQNLAERAYNNTSHSPEKRGQRDREDTVSELNRLLDEFAKRAKSDEQKQILKNEFPTFKQKYIQWQKELLSSHSNIASSFITGPSNFPVRQMQKRNAAYDNKYSNFKEWERKAIKSINSKLDKQMIEDAGGEYAIAEKELKKAEHLQEIMRSTNVIVRKKNLTDEEKINQIVELGVSKPSAPLMLKPDFAGRKGFADFEMTNNNARIKRLREKLATMGKRDEMLDKEIEVIGQFEGGRIINNYPEERVQIEFDAIPSEEIRNKLKSNGWRWSPKNKVWQRQNTQFAVNDAKRLLDGLPNKKELLDKEKGEMPQADAEASPVYQTLRDKEVYSVTEISKATGKPAKEIAKLFNDLSFKKLVTKTEKGYIPTPEFKVLLDDMFSNPDKYESTYPELYSNPIPAILKGMDRAITFLDDVFAKHIGTKIHTALGKGLKQITPEIIKKTILTNYGLPAEYVQIRKEAYENVGTYRQLSHEMADLLTYSDVKKKVKFTKAEQIRMQQIIRGSITSDPLLKERGQKAIDEIKQLEKYGKELEVLPIETYNTKLPRKRISELLNEKAKIQEKLSVAEEKLYNKYQTTTEDQQQEIADLKEQIKGLDKKDKAGKQPLLDDIVSALEKIKELNKDLFGRQVNAYQAEVDNITRKIKNSFVHGGEGYFKRVYLSKEQAKLLKQYGYIKPTRLDLTSAIARKDIPFEVRKKMGEVLTASYPVAKSIMLEGKDVSLGRFFEAVAENPDWSITDEEYKAVPREGFVKLPKDNKLGKLSGKYVLESIKADVDDIIKFTDPDYIETFLKQVTANWKATKTIMNPSTHLRNIYSNSIMLDFSGVSHAEQIRLMPEVIRMLLGSGKYAKQWKLSQLDRTTFQFQELQMYLDVIGSDRSFVNMNTQEKAKLFATKLYGKVTLVDTKLGNLLGKIYQLEELIGKGIKLVSELEKGHTIAEGKKQAQKWLFDYGDIPAIVRKLRTNPFFGIPFITWSFKAFPRIIEAAITRPIAFWKYPVIFSAIMKYSLKSLDLDDDDWEKIQATFSDRMLKGEWLLLPFKDESGKMQMLDLTYILPYKDVYDVAMSGYLLATEGHFDNRDSFVEGVLGIIQAPVFKTAAELMANKNTYTNSPIWFDKADTPTEKAQKAFDYMYKTFMPALAPEIPFLSAGGYAWHKLASVVMERDDYYGRSFTLAPAIGSSLLGLKTTPLEPEKNLERAAFKIQQEVNELGMKRNQILRDGSVDEDKRLAEAGKIDERMDELRQQKIDLNVPEYAADIKLLEKQIRSLQRKRGKETNPKRRKDFTYQINKLKIDLDKAKSSDDIYEKDGEGKQKTGYGQAYRSGYSF